MVDKVAVQGEMSDEVCTNPILGAPNSPQWDRTLVRLRHYGEAVEIKPHTFSMLQGQLLGPAGHIRAHGEQARVELHTFFSVVELGLEGRDSPGRGFKLNPELLQGRVVGSSDRRERGADATTRESSTLLTDDDVDLVVAFNQSA